MNDAGGAGPGKQADFPMNPNPAVKSGEKVTGLTNEDRWKILREPGSIRTVYPAG
jgi:hypothetical protein